MPEGTSHRQGLEAQRRLLEEQLYRLYGPEHSDLRWVSETLNRLRAQPTDVCFGDQDRADLRKVQLVLDRMKAVARFYNPDQPRDKDGKWTIGGALPNAVAYLERHAGTKSEGLCAQFVREALAQDGIDLKPADRPKGGSAKDFGPTLEKYGFGRAASAGEGAGFPPEGYKAQAGDVVVIQGIPGHKDGHMAMYTGKPTEKLSGWVSDFNQPHFYPGTDYQRIKPRYVIYRHK